MNCYILTGGRSTRMGRAKSELFLDTVVKAASPVFDRVIAVQRHGMDKLPIETIFEDEHEGEAPIFGVVRALRHSAGRAFVVATDYPLITSEFLRTLRTAFERTTAPLLVPVWHGVPQPLCAGYSSQLLPALEQRIAQRRFTLRDIPGDTMVVEGNELFNANTPADLQEAERLR